MRKKIVILVAVVFLNAINVQSQTTITPGKVWHIESGFACPYGLCCTGIHTIKTDSIRVFNGKAYYELFSDVSYGGYVVTYAREDSGRVFFYTQSCDKEYLMYDFNLNVGDTVFLVDPQHPTSFYNQSNPCELTVSDSNEYKFVVVDVDSIEYNQVKRKMLKLNSIRRPAYYDVWVEGIGCMRGITYHVAQHITGVRQLKECYESDTLIFVNENPEYRLGIRESYTAAIYCGDTYNDANFTNLTQAGVYYDTLQNIKYCDSIIELTLIINSIDTTPITATICAGSSYDFFGDSLTTSDTYYKTLQSVFGCDSVIELTLMVNTFLFTPITASICESDSYSFKGEELSDAGIYYDTLTAFAGCDSIIELSLTVNPIYFKQISDSILSGSFYNFHGKQLTTSGIYYDTLQTTFGCDSIFELMLTISNVGIVTTASLPLMRIYPNPTTGQLTINGSSTGSLPGDGTLSDQNRTLSVVEVFDVVGSKLWAVSGAELHDSQFTIDISHLANGLYFLKVDNKIFKIIKH